MSKSLLGSVLNFFQYRFRICVIKGKIVKYAKKQSFIGKFKNMVLKIDDFLKPSLLKILFSLLLFLCISSLSLICFSFEMAAMTFGGRPVPGGCQTIVFGFPFPGGFEKSCCGSCVYRMGELNFFLLDLFFAYLTICYIFYRERKLNLKNRILHLLLLLFFCLGGTFFVYNYISVSDSRPVIELGYRVFEIFFWFLVICFVYFMYSYLAKRILKDSSLDSKIDND